MTASHTASGGVLDTLPEQLRWALHGSLVAGWAGTELDPEIERLLEAGLGGVILHSRNVADADQLTDLLTRMRAIQPDLVVTVDQEGGRIGHLARAGTPPTPGAWALGVLDDPDTTTAVAGELAGHLAGLGVNSSWSPVADVQADPRNPIIRTRSFGADPQQVSKQVKAWIRGTEDAGVAAAAKHFPGHGSTTTDSHLDAAVDHRGLDALLAADLLPFRAAIEAGVSQVMTTHVWFPDIDGRPATLSPVLVRRLLRRELGFDGVVVSDALEMKAIADTVGIAPGAVGALAAGHDLICIAEPDHELHQQVIGEVAAAIVRGELDSEELLRGNERVRRLARTHSGGEGGSGAGTEDTAGAGIAAARRAIALNDRLPRLDRPCVIDLYRTPRAVLEWDGADLATLVAAGCAGATGLSYTAGEGIAAPAPGVVVGAALTAAEGRSLVVATQDVPLHHWQSEILAALRVRRPDLVHVATGLPGGDEELATYGRGVANIRAGAEALIAACR